MDQSMTLFGYLVIAFLGFLVPVLGLLFAVYQGGIEKIKIKYENKKAEAEKARHDFLSGFSTAGVNKEEFKDVKKKLKELELKEKTVRRMADSRMSYLDLRKVAIGLAAPLAASMLAVLTYFMIPISYKIPVALFSAAAFSYSVFVLTKLLDVVIEMTRLADKESKAMNARIIEALSDNPEHAKIKDLKLVVDGIQVSAENPLIISSGDERELKVEIKNSSKVMARNAVLDIKMDPKVMILPKQYYSIIRTGNALTVSYAIDFINPESCFTAGPLVIKINTPGTYKAETEMKAENLEGGIKSVFSIKVERTIKEVLENIMKL